MVKDKQAMSSDKGNTYSCDWKYGKSGYKAWLIKYPEIIAESEYFFECEDLIYYEIIDKFGDGEAILEFAKELPDELFPKRYRRKNYFVMMSGYWENLVDLESYFIEGECNACNRCIGQRNGKVISITGKAKNTDIITIRNSNILILSERILKLIESYNKDLYQLREVNFITPKRTKFFELIWNEESSDIVNSISINEEVGKFNGWKCSLCANSSIFYQDERSMKFFVPEKTLKPNELNLFRLNRGDLCFSGKLLSDIKSKVKLRKIIEEQLGVVTDEQIQASTGVEFRILEVKKRKLPG